MSGARVRLLWHSVAYISHYLCKGFSKEPPKEEREPPFQCPTSRMVLAIASKSHVRKGVEDMLLSRGSLPLRKRGPVAEQVYLTLYD